MYNHIFGLCGLSIPVGDLAMGAETFRRLGFALDAQHSVNFSQDHLQVLPGQGPATLLLGTHDMDAASQSLRQAGVEMASDQDFSLNATSGLACRLVHRAPSDLVSHPNGATGIVSVTAVVEDPCEQAANWDRIFGPYTATLTDNTLAIHTGRAHGLVFLSRLDDLTQLHPDADEDETPPSPCIAAMVLRVTDTNSAATLLRANKVQFSRDPEGTIRIPPSQACGLFLELVGE